MSVRYFVGDARAVLETMPACSVDLVLTSPPFFTLRSYLANDHPRKAQEVGNEPDPATYLSTLLEATAQWRRVLTPSGSLVVELGDTYAGSGGAGGDYRAGKLRGGQPRFDGSSARARQAGGHGWPLGKSLMCMPELYRVALAYGVHPLHHEASPAGLWLVRNVVRWCRTNPPPGRTGDKLRPSVSELVMACTDRERWWDEIAISPLAGPVPLDHWRIKASNYTGAHYATFPPELLTIPIEAMCPRRVCRSCGQPSRRVGADGWTTCGCSGTDGLRANGWHTGTGWRAGVVLDPYAGTGTTGLVASGHSRDAVLIDIDERNAELAQERIGPLGGLTVHTKGNDVWTF